MTYAIACWSDDPIKLLPYTAVDRWSAGDTDISACAERVLTLWTTGVAVRSGE
ncbi:MAG: hypothetical protein JWL79_3726 [Frankiales bacterium]|nr:hypothetical protein [Frankiales bacterium]